MKVIRRTWLLAAALPLVCGCRHRNAGNATTQPVIAITQAQVIASLDAVPITQFVFQVEVFVLSVPRESISGNEEFWKRIDEQVVDPATYDLLYKNGIRVGEAPLAELTHFAKFMEGVVPMQKFSVAGPEVRDMQIDMKTNLSEQTVFHFDRENTPIGRTFDNSDNVMNISFEPAMRKPGQLRLTLAPMVRAKRKRLQYTDRNNEIEVQYATEEVIYDLNFKVDLPMDSFLIVTPSPDASRPTSVGNAFFMKDAAAEQLEEVLIVRSQPYRMQPPPPVKP